MNKLSKHPKNRVLREQEVSSLHRTTWDPSKICTNITLSLQIILICTSAHQLVGKNNGDKESGADLFAWTQLHGLWWPRGLAFCSPSAFCCGAHKKPTKKFGSTASGEDISQHYPLNRTPPRTGSSSPRHLYAAVKTTLTTTPALSPSLSYPLLSQAYKHSPPFPL